MSLGKSERVLYSWSGKLNFMGGCVLIIMMLLTVVDVVLRYFFGHPLVGAFEFTESMLVIVIFFAAADTEARDGHISADLVVARLSKKSQVLLSVITYLSSVIMVGLFTWRSLLQGTSVWRKHETYATYPIPVAPFIFVVVLGFALWCLILLVKFIMSVHTLRALGR